MLFVGQASLVGDITRYAQHFNLLEVQAEPGKLPKPAGLKKWVEQAGERFAFSLRIPTSLWEADPERTQTMLDYANGVAEVLKPVACVLQTPASATPTQRNRARLESLARGLQRSGMFFAWEPRGIWEPRELVTTADALGAWVVRDLSRDDALGDGERVYTRLRALGGATHVGSGVAYDLADKLADYDEAYVVIEGSGARGAAKVLRENLEDARQ